jgi:hypothetical protein
LHIEAFLEFYGPDFMVDAALANSPLKEYARIWHRGTHFNKLAEQGHKHSGFDIWAGGDDGMELEQQIAEAVITLRDNAEEIRRIRALPDVKTAQLRLGELWPENIVARFPRLPNELLLVCGELGLDIVLCEYLTRGNSTAEKDPS